MWVWWEREGKKERKEKRRNGEEEKGGKGQKGEQAAGRGNGEEEEEKGSNWKKKWKRIREIGKRGDGWWKNRGFYLGFCFLNEGWRSSMKMEGADGLSKKWV